METKIKISSKHKKKEMTTEEIEHMKEMTVKINFTFSEYYKQVLMMTEKEFGEFYSKSMEKLPITFRISKINTYCAFAESELTDLLHNKSVKRYNFNSLNNIVEIEIDHSDSHRQLRDLLIRENDMGILRQELVAMLPVYLVNIEDDHVILDMCASPGNKSVQILELMHEKARRNNILPRGALIANELDFKRSENLVHFLKGQFPINVIVIQGPAQDLPLIKDENYRPDVVFCDVPCSGDGTLRKNKGLRKRWRLDYGYHNHPVQRSILENAIKQCKVGGMIVYSTCSINPIENEAVVCAVLEKYKNTVELVDMNKRMNEIGLAHAAGLVKWKVCYDWADNLHLQWAYDISQVTKNEKMIESTMFHPVYTKSNYQSSIYFKDPLNIRRCIRLYSHLNNTGSFFIAVMKKTASHETIETSDSYSVPLNKNKMKSIADDLQEFMDFLGFEEKEKEEEKCKHTASMNINLDAINNPTLLFPKFVPLKDFTQNYHNLQDVYQFKLQAIAEQLYSNRNESGKLFFLSEKLSQMMEIFFQMEVNILRVGMVAFKKERKPKESKVKHIQITHYGAIMLEQYMKGQVIEINQHDEKFVTELLHSSVVKFESIPENILAKVKAMCNGSVIVIYESLVILCRKGKNSVSLMIPDEILSNLRRYYDKYVATQDVVHENQKNI